MNIKYPKFFIENEYYFFNKHLDTVSIDALLLLFKQDRNLFNHILTEFKMRGIEFENTNQRIFRRSSIIIST